LLHVASIRLVKTYMAAMGRAHKYQRRRIDLALAAWKVSQREIFMKNYICYGHDLSYFTRKLEAALMFYGADFTRQSVNLTFVDETARKRAGTHVIPVLETPEGWALWDTTPMMRMLDGRFSARRMFPHGETGLLVHIIENFLDEWLGRTMVHYRWHYSECAEIAASALAMGNDAIAKNIAAWGAKACRATGTDLPHQRDMAEAEYERILTAVDAQLALTPYLLGDAPCAVDAVILGGLRAHTMIDPVPSRLVDKFPRIRAWAEIGGGADQWNGSGSANGSTGFAAFMLDEMQRCFITFALANRAALKAREKLVTVNIYDEDVTYLVRSYPEMACQMVSEHMKMLGVGAYVEALGLSELYL
jgi:glutathione S-transferase